LRNLAHDVRYNGGWPSQVDSSGFKVGQNMAITPGKVVYRTDLIDDPAIMAAVDAELAVKVTRWPSMSRGQLAGRIDKIVARADVDAVRRRKDRQGGREIEIWECDSGMAEISAACSPPTGTPCRSDSMRWPPRSVNTIRAPARSAAPTPGGVQWKNISAIKSPESNIARRVSMIERQQPYVRQLHVCINNRNGENKSCGYDGSEEVV
jgi:hypothetical protein